MDRGYSIIGLNNPKNPLNVGEALRACGCYGARMLVLSGNRPERYIGKDIPTDTQRQWKHTPVLLTDDLQSILPYGCEAVAVDIIEGATPLAKFSHPERAFYIFGGEDSTLDEKVISWCKHTVYIPTKYCMNLAATVNVVLYDRAVKHGKE